MLYEINLIEVHKKWGCRASLQSNRWSHFLSWTAVNILFHLKPQMADETLRVAVAVGCRDQDKKKVSYSAVDTFEKLGHSMLRCHFSSPEVCVAKHNLCRRGLSLLLLLLRSGSTLPTSSICLCLSISSNCWQNPGKCQTFLFLKEEALNKKVIKEWILMNPILLKILLGAVSYFMMSSFLQRSWSVCTTFCIEQWGS